MIDLVMRVVDLVFGLLGLLLILRVVLRIFNVRSGHPVMVVLVKLTEPVVSLASRILGIPSYRYRYTPGIQSRSDLVGPLITVVLLWGIRTVLVWVLRIAQAVPLWVVRPLGSIGTILRYLLSLGFDLYELAIFVRIIFEWLRVPYSSRVMNFLYSITEPVLAPIRQALPPFYGIDFSPIVAYLLLRLLRRVIFTMLGWIF